jgi:hypothetical protein
MADPLTIASTALGILKQTTEGLSALRERAQRSKDTDIKDQINALYDNVLSLKEVVSRLLDDNAELKRQLVQQQTARAAVPKIKQVGETQYYFQGEEGPFCQVCYDGAAKTLVRVSPQYHSEWDHAVTRECPICRRTFTEQRGREQTHVEPFSPGEWS